ncbi:interferon-induced GTP-binding protein mx2 [Lasiosphaeris hirsuta]|uniref:Interferon-induced GTP-binding protein mx2 n=1 Tax=Lasiosphaeris hirsuta TaxID=260670 RepID=A0AA40AES3_9PEZI|nr:interferon-induced GTP-binding protein mx2 [Lasiosphaeris hirsuta]
MEPSAALTSPSRLRKIDILREKNIGQYLPLPQLVAVGDQSSGKSSLLESITGIPFPHGQELCTRYATQITHRRDEFQRIDVSIIPGPHASPEHCKLLKSYHRQVPTDNHLFSEFPTILNEVNAAMGIRTKTNPAGPHTFSEDVLKIEKCGPNEDYLTVIDVPGIFRATAEDITAKDRDLVKNMVKRYIKDDRTIVLAVLPSNVDAATQEILELAKEYDKTGDRTLGVLTKPDSLQERSQKLSVCNLVLGKRMPLTLGYYIVRNRGGDDNGATDVDFSERERMFMDDPWSTLPRERVGVVALRARLQELLGQITDRAFPKLLSETRNLYKAAERDLFALGASRHTERQQQAYLMRAASKFQEFVRDALAANYSYDEAFGESNELRLITTIVNLTADFSRDFDSISHSHRFKPAKAAKPHDWAGDYVMMMSSVLAEYPELEGLIVTDRKNDQPTDDIMEWIGQMRLGSRGVELGTFGPAMLASAFREQSQKWRAMTEQYISNVILAVHQFFHKALELACPDARTRERLKPSIMDELLERYNEGMNHARMLVAVERVKRPYTLSEMFNRNLQTSRGHRVAAALAPKARNEWTKGGSSHEAPKLVVEYKDIETAITNRSNEAYEKEDIHDILEAYYNVARKRFVDNVWHQAVDHVLLSGPTSPLGLFSEQWVIQLDRKKLEMVAGEPLGVTERREALSKRMLDLKEAMNVLR